METHEVIKRLREERGMSQDALAEKVGYKDRSSIAKVEAGLVDLSQSKIAAFAKALGVSPAQLIGAGSESDPHNQNANLSHYQIQIKEARKMAQMTQKELAARLGISVSTLSEYESGKYDPRSDVLCEIANICGVSVDFLLCRPEAKNAPSISDEAMKIAVRYEKLDHIGRGAVNAIVKYEEGRMADAGTRIGQYNSEAGTMLDMIVYTNPSAAGIPLYAENDYEHIEFPASEVPRGADFGVRISGDSMEPTIHDGTIVWVHKVPELQEGQIGIFMIDDGAVCKRFYNTGSGIELRSDNSKYDPIKVSEFERLGIVGRVLGYK